MTVVNIDNSHNFIEISKFVPTALFLNSSWSFRSTLINKIIAYCSL